jgi:hypothetical protein
MTLFSFHSDAELIAALEAEYPEALEQERERLRADGPQKIVTGWLRRKVRR